MKIINISWNIFKKTFGLNPALIWERKDLVNYINNIFDESNSIDNFIEFGEETDENGNLFDYSKFEYEDSVFHDFGAVSKGNFVNQNDYIKVFKDNYDRYNNDAINYYLKKYNLKKPKYISTKNSIEVKINETLNAIADPEIDVIINGTIGYSLIEGENNFLFNLPFLIFDKKNDKLVLLSYTKAKYELYYKFFFANNLFIKNNLIIRDMSTILINPYTKLNGKITKNKIEFYESFAASPNKSISKPTGKNLTDMLKEFSEAITKSGDNLLFINNKYDKNNSVYSFLKASKNMIFPENNISLNFNDLLLFNYSKKDITSYREGQIVIPFKNEKKSNNDSDYAFTIFNYDFYEKIITKSYFDFKNINLDAIVHFLQFNNKNDKKNLVENWLNGNLNTFNHEINNIYFDDMLGIDKEEKYAIFKFLTKDKFERISFKYYKNISKNNIKSIIDENKKFNETDNFFTIAALNKIKKLHKKDAKICWYDYEGFAELYPPLNNIGPYNQIVNQVSIIITKNGNEIDKKNIVCDTKNLKLIDLVKMIDQIHSDDYDYYVVYNKSYENTRNREIKKLVEKAFKDNDVDFINEFNKIYKEKSEFDNKINKINNNTIDLLDCFGHSKLNSYEIKDYFTFLENGNDIEISDDKNVNLEKNNKILEKTRIHIKFLNYFYSIKGIEKYINKMNFDLRSKITPYSELVIQKGTMAMEVAILRHVNGISDNVWEQNVVPELKRYCENDVRAMIMVYDFIMFLFRKKFPEIEEYEYKLEDVENEQKNYTYSSGKITYNIKND
ncbi:DUF2779 domain-containing protein [Mycoplasma sp. CSL10137]|uniref:UU173 family protein n=1 Tax=unclassified Mycoplasma TaxID=2683645 RepID=UPI00197B8EF5|nr:MULTISPECIES: DUF2779 domain-containing protein [unclassified Mycoplasma]MBN4083522.1 DUF2779 domain-containing protein [Mycoplasma sp. CSL10137]MBU4693026.1 DUF2779 domain-containing protein [Mycoplasma sp. CSL7491-lung]